MVQQKYDVYVEMEHVILGNDVIFKCKIPSHMSDLASVTAWVDNQGENFVFGSAARGKFPRGTKLSRA